MHRSSGEPPADTAAVKTRRDGTAGVPAGVLSGTSARCVSCGGSRTTAGPSGGR